MKTTTTTTNNVTTTTKRARRFYFNLEKPVKRHFDLEKDYSK